MNWNGTTITSARDVFDAANACTTQDEAHAFLAAFRADHELAEPLIGYAINLHGDDEAKERLEGLFPTAVAAFRESASSAVQADPGPK